MRRAASVGWKTNLSPAVAIVRRGKSSRRWLLPGILTLCGRRRSFNLQPFLLRSVVVTHDGGITVSVTVVLVIIVVIRIAFAIVGDRGEVLPRECCGYLAQPPVQVVEVGEWCWWLEAARLPWIAWVSGWLSRVRISCIASMTFGLTPAGFFLWRCVQREVKWRAGGVADGASLET
ncbi:hypothetical protein ABW21_db0200361 [Orbilia brochopaga]|nr:hypothetical protein ABW21_db0200361 [Drechslerella brochopaga]